MVGKGPQPLLRAVERLYPDLLDPRVRIEQGAIAVDGRIVRNSASAVGPASRITLVGRVPLRGEAKLRAAFRSFNLVAKDRIALDCGAAAGGFTTVLLEHGALRVYAVDVGHGQLLGSLRQDPSVVNLEATNLAALDREVVPDLIDLFTLDLSYLSLTDAFPQLESLRIAEDADMVALVKPMFELHLSRPPDDADSLRQALDLAMNGARAAGWTTIASIESPVLGARGAFEFLLHARRTPTDGSERAAITVRA